MRAGRFWGGTRQSGGLGVEISLFERNRISSPRLKRWKMPLKRKRCRSLGTS